MMFGVKDRAISILFKDIPDHRHHAVFDRVVA